MIDTVSVTVNDNMPPGLDQTKEIKTLKHSPRPQSGRANLDLPCHQHMTRNLQSRKDDICYSK